MSYDPIWSIAAVDGESKAVVVGRESGKVEKYAANHLLVPLLSIAAHNGPVTALSVVSADEVYAASTDKTVALWSIAAEVEGKRQSKVFNVDEVVRSLLVQGEVLYAGGEDGEIKVLGAEPAAWKGHQGAVVALGASDSMLCSGSYDNQVRLWDFSGRCLYVLLGHTNHVKACVISSGFVVGAARDETLQVWTIPADGDDAAAGEQKDGDGAAVKEQARPPRVVLPSGTLALPATPTSFAVAAPTIFLGCSNAGVYSINAKQLAAAVADFERAALSQHKKLQMASVRKTAEFVAAEKKKLARALRLKRKALLQQQRDEASAAKKAEQQQQERGVRDDEDDERPEEPETVEQEGEGDGTEAELSESLQAMFDAFKSAKEEKASALIADAERLARKYEESLQPLLKQKYSIPVEKFGGLPFTRSFPKGSEAVLAIAVDGSNGYIADGASVRYAELKVGITSL